jgi:hypothetical protein
MFSFTCIIHIRIHYVRQVYPLLENDREISTTQEQLLGNASSNKYASKTTIALQQRNGGFYAFHAEMI